MHDKNKERMEQQLTEIVEKYLKGNYLFGRENRAKMISEILVCVSDFSDFELQRLFDWLQDSKREPAQTKFTAGMTRNVAREFENLLKHSR